MRKTSYRRASQRFCLLHPWHPFWAVVGFQGRDGIDGTVDRVDGGSCVCELGGALVMHSENELGEGGKEGRCKDGEGKGKWFD